MKQILLIIVFAFGIFTACENETKPEKIEETPVDLAKIEKEIENAAKETDEAMKNKDIEYFKNTLDDNGLFIGTDPEEYWTKDTLMVFWEKMVEDTTLKFDQTTDKRVINVGPGGKSAIVTSQAVAKHISKHMPTRTTARYIFVDSIWKIDYISWSPVPTNDQLRYMWKVFEEKGKKEKEEEK
jgi:hypothetical protein